MLPKNGLSACCQAPHSKFASISPQDEPCLRLEDSA